MKTKQLLDVLMDQARALDDAGARDSGRALAALALAFEPVAELTFAQLQKRLLVQGTAKPTTSGPMVGDTIEAVVMLSKVVGAAGAKPAAKDLASLAATLKSIGDESIEALLARLSIAPERRTAKARSSAAKTFDPSLARQYADRLTRANLDDHKFKQILAEMTAAKLSKDMIAAIASQFLGYDRPRPYKSIKDAFQKIEERHFLDALTESRARAIQRINA